MPTLWPIGAYDLGRHLDLDSLTTDDANYIEELVPAAFEMVERDCQRAIVSRNWVLKMDSFPSDEIELRMPPVSTVVSITYVDSDGDSQTLSSSVYETDLASAPARIVLGEGQSWPEAACVPNAVTVTFTAGYADGDLPFTLKQACLLAAGSLYYRCDPSDAYWSLIRRNAWEFGL